MQLLSSLLEPNLLFAVDKSHCQAQRSILHIASFLSLTSLGASEAMYRHFVAHFSLAALAMSLYLFPGAPGKATSLKQARRTCIRGRLGKRAFAFILFEG